MQIDFDPGPVALLTLGGRERPAQAEAQRKRERVVPALSRQHSQTACSVHLISAAVVSHVR